MQNNQLTFTKSELRDTLGCTTWKRFYAIFMTEHVIQQRLGITKEEYKRIREFSVEQSRVLREYFELRRD
jgi:hypothetical protein